MTENSKEISPFCRKFAKIKRELCFGDNNEFARKLGVSRQRASIICNSEKSIGAKTIERVLKAFPEVSRVWLYNDIEPMLITDKKQPKPATQEQPNNNVIELLMGQIEEKDRQIMEKDKQISMLMKIINSMTEGGNPQFAMGSAERPVDYKTK